MESKGIKYDQIIAAIVSIGKRSDTRFTVVDAEDEYRSNPVACKKAAEKYLASVQVRERYDA